ncbi:helix-turn-helix transcriptional regulator [Nocardia takedensis]
MTDDDTARSDSRVDPEGRRIAERIRTEREYLNLKQEQVAEVLGISRAAVSAIETGRRKVTAPELKKLAQLFGTSVDRLLGADPAEDETTTALFRTARTLSDNDRMQVLRFAEFLRNAGPAPTLDEGGTNESNPARRSP